MCFHEWEKKEYYSGIQYILFESKTTKKSNSLFIYENKRMNAINRKYHVIIDLDPLISIIPLI